MKLLTLLAVAAVASAGPPAPAPLECPMRQLILAQAQKLQPNRDHSQTFDALELSTRCGLPRPEPAPPRRKRYGAPPPGAIHVDASRGRDGAGRDGGADAPLRSVAAALALWRSRRLAHPAAAPAPVVLQPGVHVLSETMELGPKDSFLEIRSADAKGDAWLSGGQQLSGLAWKQAGGGMPKAVYKAKLTGLKQVHGRAPPDARSVPQRRRRDGAGVCPAPAAASMPLVDTC